MPQEVLRTIYYAHVYPLLTYCNPIWCTTYPTYLIPLKLQLKKIVRIITNSNFLECTNPLFKETKIIKQMTLLNLLLLLACIQIRIKYRTSFHLMTITPTTVITSAFPLIDLKNLSTQFLIQGLVYRTLYLSKFRMHPLSPHLKENIKIRSQLPTNLNYYLILKQQCIQTLVIISSTLLYIEIISMLLLLYLLYIFQNIYHSYILFIIYVLFIITIYYIICIIYYHYYLLYLYLL